MFSPKFINSEHKDLIHDVAFDHYGRRMATCSSDQFVKVWDREQGDERWKKSAEWKAHSGSVWKVAWAHPEFGQILATCSFDRTAAVWEEIVGESYNVIGQKHWARRTNLVDSRTSVTDVKFGPKSSGLVLATCSADGVIRIYEAPDVMNLAQWTLQQEVPCKYQASCVSWNPSYTGRITSKEPEESEAIPPRAPVLAVGFDDQNCPPGNRVVILQNLTGMRKWNRMDCSTQATENVFNAISDPVHDLAFAPRLGRSYDLLAVATKDVKLYTLCQVASKSSPKLRLGLIATLDDHSGTVWRISWNSVGSILASSGDDRCVRLWKQCPLVFKKDRDKDNNRVEKPEKNFIWQCVSTIKGDSDTYP